MQATSTYLFRLTRAWSDRAVQGPRLAAKSQPSTPCSCRRLCSGSSGSSPRSSTFGSARLQVAENYIRGEVPGGERAVVGQARGQCGCRCAVHAPSRKVQLPTVCCEKQGISRAGGPALQYFSAARVGPGVAEDPGRAAGGAGRHLSLHAVLPQSASDRRGGIQARDGRQRLGAHMLYDSCRCGDKPDQILFSLVLLCVFTVNLIGVISIRCVCFFFFRSYSLFVTLCTQA